jgi:hypothetical protein
MRGAKSLTKGLVSPKGKPRYVKGKEPTIHPKEAASESVFWALILIGTRQDLW